MRLGLRGSVTVCDGLIVTKLCTLGGSNFNAGGLADLTIALR
jgi:hypothetical protein